MKITGRIVQTTLGGVLFIAGGKRVWLPRLEIRNLPREITLNQEIALSIPRWLAAKKGLGK